MRLFVAFGLAVCVVGAAAAGTASVRLKTSPVVVVPDTPRAGHTFSASMRVTRRDSGAVVRSGKVTCSARVATSGKHVLGWLRLDALGGLARRFFGRPIL